MQGGAGIPIVAAKLRPPAADSYGLVRLDSLMNRLWSRKLGLVVAPAGSGKTTLLARFASTAGVPVAWYRCESWDVTQDQLLRHLAEAFAGVLAGPQEWPSVEDAVFALEQAPAQPMLLVIDDAHAISGTAAERALERLVDYAPSNLLTVIASRSQPDFNLSRLRVSGTVTEIGGDDLRFRSWEVENLFREFYREPLPPVELAELARRTEGWAAGLQLFHLATSGKGMDERRRILRSLGGGSRLVREYLARNVLDELPRLLRAFLVDTCVLGRLNGPICNRFLNRSDSEGLLQELERRQIFTSAVGNDGDYRYHEVLRSHLEHVLVSEAGERALNVRYGAAGRVLEQFDAIPEALHAYCRAQSWGDVDRLLGRNGAQLAQRTGVWIDALPPAVLEHDPWLLLASARRHRAEGRWLTAIAAYQRAEAGFTGDEAIQTCQRERQALSAWLSPSIVPASDTVGLLRQATIRDPAGTRAQPAGESAGENNLLAGLTSLLAGDVVAARRWLAVAAESGDDGDAAGVGARVGAAVASLLAGADGAASELARAVEDADACGQGLIARLGRACAALEPGGGGVSEAAAVRTVCEHIGDEWGAAIARLLEGWGSVAARKSDVETVVGLRSVADVFQKLGAGVLEAWSRSLLAFALAEQGDPDAYRAALKAESLANSTAVEGPKLFAYLALAQTGKGNTRQFIDLATAIHGRTGLAPRVLEQWTQPAPELPAAPLIRIRCFGEFHFSMNGHPIVMASMKPRTRALLRRLCADAGSPIHREVLQEALWPNADADAASRNLHVAISSLRQALEPGIARGASSLLVREGDAYRLVLPADADVDLRTFEQALEQSRRARLNGESQAAFDAFKQAATIAQGDLLPEDGSADWVVQRRGRVLGALLEAARPLARQLLANGRPDLAVEASVAGLDADRYDDGLWRTLIEAREKSGDEAGTRRARAEYRKIVLELEPQTTRS